MTEPTIRASDQIVMVGKNGSGKSVLGRYVFAQVRSQKVWVLVKRDPDVLAWLTRRYGEENVSYAEGDPAMLDFRRRVLVYQMAKVTGKAGLEELDALYARLNTRSNIHVHNDEIYGPQTANRVSDEFAVYLQHGRSSNRRHAAMTQRPKRIPTNIISEAQHLVWFPRGFNSTDRKFLADEIGFEDDRLRELAIDVLDASKWGEYGHLWYEQRRHRVFRCVSCPHP